MDFQELLCDLVRMPSVSDDISEVNKCVDFLCAKLEAEGLFCAKETFDGVKALWASNVADKRPDLMVVVHLDVVPVDSSDEFNPVIDGDRMIGRGTFDCKGQAVAAIAALLDVAADKSSGATMGVLFATDEETGGHTTGWMVDRGYGASKAALVYDTNGGSDICIGQKGIVNLRLTAEGHGGHASEPWNFDNPVLKLCDAIIKLNAWWAGRYPHTDDNWHNSLAPTILSAGKVQNQIPDMATAMLNIRFIETTTAEALAEEVREVTGLKTEITETTPCVCLQPSGPAFEALSEIISAHFGGAKVGFSRMCGATDARHLAPLGVPIAISGVDGGCAHRCGEYVELPSIRRFASIAADFARRLAKL